MVMVLIIVTAVWMGRVGKTGFLHVLASVMLIAIVKKSQKKSKQLMDKKEEMMIGRMVHSKVDLAGSPVLTETVLLTATQKSQTEKISKMMPMRKI